MAIKVPTSKGSLVKGELWMHRGIVDVADGDRFGWVNASYVYGLSFLPMHMKRALGTLTPHETFAKATEIKLALDDTIQEGSDESRQDSPDDAAVSSSPDE